MTISSGTLLVNDATSTQQAIVAVVDSVAGTTTPAHAVMDPLTGKMVSPLPLVASSASFTRPANTTAYASGQLVANSTTAGSVVANQIAIAKGVGVNGLLTGIKLQKSGVAATGAGSDVNANFRVHFFSAAPIVTNGDGAAYVPTNANWLGSCDITIDHVGSDMSVGRGAPTIGYPIAFQPVAGTNYVYWLLEARNAYTPASAETFTLIGEVQ